MNTSYESSTIDWCEDNYQVSYYIAEVLNTFSNIPFLILSYYGLQNHHGPHEKVFWTIMALIGLFSAYFHATLSELGQVLDEEAILLFMIWLEIELHLKISMIVISTITLFALPYFNRFYLAIAVCYQFSKFYFNPQHHHPELKRLYETLMVFYSLAGILWIIDLTLCHYLYISLHWIWHLTTALGMYQTIIYLKADREIHHAIKDGDYVHITWRYWLLPDITIHRHGDPEFP
jgi:hypothetical protein